ncbi:MAG: branched-chain amino acid ABC transporter permease, partial [Anaerolineae bacterium]|nr:branched-chain amino acid ABC transporter permease [Anaerolineae bacterium]
MLKNLRNPGLWLWMAIVLAVGLWPVITQRASTREEIFTVLLSVVLASSLNILLGYTGYVSFGHIVFFGLGGYVGLFLITAYGWSLWPAMLAGGVSSAFLALLLGQAILRLRGAYFALATIGINEAMRAFINNFE